MFWVLNIFYSMMASKDDGFLYCSPIKKFTEEREKKKTNKTVRGPKTIRPNTAGSLL